MWAQILLYALLWSLPIAFATLSAWAFAQSFYKVKFNKVGITINREWIPAPIRRKFKKLDDDDDEEINWGDTAEVESVMTKIKRQSQRFLHIGASIQAAAHHRRTVLIATMEYNIEDWDIKIKIGGLGVMSGLMGQHLGYQDLIWVGQANGQKPYAELVIITSLSREPASYDCCTRTNPWF